MTATRSGPSLLTGELTSLRSEIEKRHDESIQRLQHWMKNPSIAGAVASHAAYLFALAN